MHHRDIVTTLVLVIHGYLYLSVEGRCMPKARCRRSESRTNHVLQGHVYRELEVHSYPACFAECKKDKRCMSLNYNLVKLICQLNHQTATTKPSWLVWRKDSIYAERIDRYSVGSCENPGKSCKMILQTLGRTSSGEYFIDPTKSGEPFTVFCDMRTNGGGWTVVKRSILKSSSPDTTKVQVNDYRAISNYILNTQLVNPLALLVLRQQMGFDQIRWYCYKKSVGRVLHIMTQTNPQGEAVVKYFTDDAYVKSHGRPPCANSFTRLPDDSSVWSQRCSAWKKWGSTKAQGSGRIYYRFIYTSRHGFSFTPRFYICDENFGHVKRLNAGDTFEVYVR